MRFLQKTFNMGKIPSQVFILLPPLKNNSHNPKHHGDKSNRRNNPILPINHFHHPVLYSGSIGAIPAL